MRNPFVFFTLDLILAAAAVMVITSCGSASQQQANFAAQSTAFAAAVAPAHQAQIARQ